MAACSLKKNLLLLELIDKHPVRFDMAISSPMVVPYQFMVFAFVREWLFLNQQRDDIFYFLFIFPSF